MESDHLYIVGIFSFSINWSIFESFIKFLVLPLGVWILYGWYYKSKKDTWRNYRVFAWIGFFSNFLFIFATLVSSLVHGMIYPKDEPTTYISNVEKASIIKIHPSGNYQTFNEIKLQKQIEMLEKADIYNDKWYEETWQGETPKNERFPYQLLGVLPKWGSGFKLRFFLIRDRRFNGSNDGYTYLPRVQMEKSITINQKPYGIMKLPKDWISFMDSFIKVESAKQPDSMFQSFFPEQHMYIGWIPYNYGGKETFPEKSVNGNGYALKDINIDHLMILNEVNFK